MQSQSHRRCEFRRIPIPSLDLLRQPEQKVRGVDAVFYALNERLSADESRHYGRDAEVVLTSSSCRFGSSAKELLFFVYIVAFSGAEV